MNSKENILQPSLIVPIILFACVTRIAVPPMLGHPVNFSPIDAIALLCGAYVNKRSNAIFVTLLTVWVSDLLVNRLALGSWVLFYQGFYWQYACYILIVLLGSGLTNNIKPTNVILAGFSASMLFFLISNLGVWFTGVLYPLTFQGLIACYIAALPFLKNTILSDFIFTIVLFAIFEQKYAVVNYLKTYSRYR